MTTKTLKLLDAVTATGPGPNIDKVPGAVEALGRHTPQLNGYARTTVTGAPTQVTINIEASRNGVDWFFVMQHDVTANGDDFVIPNCLGRYIRADLVTLTAGTTPTVTLDVDAVLV